MSKCRIRLVARKRKIAVYDEMLKDCTKKQNATEREGGKNYARRSEALSEQEGVMDNNCRAYF